MLRNNNKLIMGTDSLRLFTVNNEYPVKITCVKCEPCLNVADGLVVVHYSKQKQT